MKGAMNPLSILIFLPLFSLAFSAGCRSLGGPGRVQYGYAGQVITDSGPQPQPRLEDEGAGYPIPMVVRVYPRFPFMYRAFWHMGYPRYYAPGYRHRLAPPKHHHRHRHYPR